MNHGAYSICIHTDHTQVVYLAFLNSTLLRIMWFVFYSTGFRHADPIAPTVLLVAPTRLGARISESAVSSGINKDATPGPAESCQARPTGSRSRVPQLLERAKCGNGVL